MIKNFPTNATIYCIDSETVPDVLALMNALCIKFTATSTYEGIIDTFRKERFEPDAKNPMFPLAFQQIVALPCLRFSFSLEAGNSANYKMINYIAKPLPKTLPKSVGSVKDNGRTEWLLEGLKKERSAIMALMEDIVKDQEKGNTVVLLTWNGHGFDMPVFLMRANRRFPESIASGTPIASSNNNELLSKFFARAKHKGEEDLFGRFTPLNLDLMKAIAGEHGFSARTKQADYAAIQNVPGKVQGEDDSDTMDGSKVANLYFQRPAHRQRIIDYGSHDVLTLALLFINTMQGFGMINAETRSYYYKGLVNYVEREIRSRKSGKPHPFTIWHNELIRLNPHGF